MKLAQVTNGLNTFFFKPQPVQNVALMRIVFGVLLVANWIMLWSHLEDFWGVSGLVSQQTADIYTSIYTFNFFTYFPIDARVPTILAIVNLLAAVGVLFGFFTRTSVAVAFLTLLSFHQRNIFILNSADLIFRNMLFFLMFTPCGLAYSLDRWIAVRRGKVHGPPPERAPWALRLIQIQFSMVYIATVMFKMKGEAWADGTAIYIATRLDEFAKSPMPLLLNNLMVIKFLTWSTLVVELSLGTLIWIKEFRYWVLLAGVGLHFGIEMTMNIPLFEYIMMAGMIGMIDSRDIIRVQQWFADKTSPERFVVADEIIHS
jgi:Vitamin K-dependent gamma-carboxylase.